MSGLHKAKKSKKLRKVGHNANSCLAYKNSNRREKNKVKKLLKHLSRFGNDNCAKVSLGNTKVLLGVR
jgi:hypothetical protein